jgi:hypothetical protein
LRFAFKKTVIREPIRTPSPTPSSDPSPPCVMEETDGYDTPDLAQELGLNCQSEPMDTPPESFPEAPSPNREADQDLPMESQNDEELLYDCRSQSTEEIEECGVGVGNPLP